MSDGGHRVPAGLYWKTRLVDVTRPLWEWLGRIESSVLRDELDTVRIDRPVYVTALARSGTTIVTEILNAHPDVTAHHYADFPFVDVPYWRNWLHRRTRFGAPEPVERAHRDRIMVTEDSPEAVEEVLWMRAFPGRHDPRVSQVLAATDRNPKFDACYRDQIRKLLLVRGADRYLAKGNYNVSRIGYLLDLFPDARFVVPVRRPVDHIASLLKQHRHFSAGQAANPRVRFQLGASGHFEFGEDRQAIHLGDEMTARAIRQAWEAGDEVRGWALYWSAVYDYLWALRNNSEAAAQAMLFVRFEELCSKPREWIGRMLEHAQLDPALMDRREEFAERLAPPDYYRPDFTPAELDTIEQLTADTAACFGYVSED